MMVVLGETPGILKREQIIILECNLSYRLWTFPLWNPGGQRNVHPLHGVPEWPLLLRLSSGSMRPPFQLFWVGNNQYGLYDWRHRQLFLVGGPSWQSRPKKNFGCDPFAGRGHHAGLLASSYHHKPAGLPFPQWILNWYLLKF